MQSAKEENGSFQRTKNEALLTAGMGYGRRKALLMETFWSIVLPGLLNIGWEAIDGEGDKVGSMLFVPPNVNTKTGKRNVDYYDKVKMVLSRVEERRNREEAKIADLFREKTRDDHEIQLLTRPAERVRRGPGRPPKLGTSLLPKSVRVVDISWKEGGSAYPKRSSQVGEDHQVNPEKIPPAGSYRSNRESTEPSYEMIWNNQRGEETGVGSHIDRKVPFSKKEKALELFHKSGYTLENASELVDKIPPTDCSDWTEDEKELFRNEIFRLRKDLKALCGVMGKTMGQILSYYLGTYKKSDDYRLLKTVILEDKLEKARSSAHVVDQCAICEDGGSLLICDGCESEWHMTCTMPKLKEVPEGHWECELCTDNKFLEGRQRVIQSLGIFNQNGKRSLENSETNQTSNKKSRAQILDVVKNFAAKIDSILQPKEAVAMTEDAIPKTMDDTPKTGEATKAEDALRMDQGVTKTEEVTKAEDAPPTEQSIAKTAEEAIQVEKAATETAEEAPPKEQTTDNIEEAPSKEHSISKTAEDAIDVEHAATKTAAEAPPQEQEIAKPEEPLPTEQAIAKPEEAPPTEQTIAHTEEVPSKEQAIATSEEATTNTEEQAIATSEKAVQIEETAATTSTEEAPQVEATKTEDASKVEAAAATTNA